MIALTFLQHVTRWIGVLFLAFYAYQLLYIPVALAPPKKARQRSAPSALRCADLGPERGGGHRSAP